MTRKSFDTPVRFTARNDYAVLSIRTSMYVWKERVSAMPKHRLCMEPAASVPLLCLWNR